MKEPIILSLDYLNSQRRRVRQLVINRITYAVTHVSLVKGEMIDGNDWCFTLDVDEYTNFFATLSLALSASNEFV